MASRDRQHQLRNSIEQNTSYMVRLRLEFSYASVYRVSFVQGDEQLFDRVSVTVVPRQ